MLKTLLRLAPEKIINTAIHCQIQAYNGAMSTPAIGPLSAVNVSASPLLIEAYRIAPLKTPRDVSAQAPRPSKQETEALKASALPHEAIVEWPKQGISTRQIISLTRRYQLQSLTYEQLYNIPDSQLNPEEKAFIRYLRFNKAAFNWFSSLDGQSASLSPQDIQTVATLAHHPGVILPEDLKRLSDLARTKKLEQLPQDTKAFHLLKTSDLIGALHHIHPEPLTVDHVLALNPEQTGLAGKALASLYFLQWSPVARLLPQVTQPYAGRLTPDALRVLMAIIFNPLIYNYMPRVRFPSSSLTTASVYSVTGAEGLHPIQPDREPLRPDTGDRLDLALRLEAHEVLVVCHQLNPDGHVSLQQLRDYHPDSPEHAKVANLLRQTMIFQALAGLDHDNDTLSDDDIAKALSQGAIILPDHHRLVILP
ncbi:MAG: hypothetical protein VKK59_01245 [Vampirovibrionales bacterium]|nr:hypothetical protein [Vampirovibrionales bacterium]